MQSVQTTTISDDQLLELIESIWTTMLGLSVSRAGDDRLDPSDTWATASVRISGAVQGAVVLLTTERFARRATALMLDAQESAVTAAELDDAVAEMCNIIGGGVKSILPGPSSLSLPSVARGPQESINGPHTQIAARLQFLCEGQPLDVRVLTYPAGVMKANKLV